MCFLGLASLMGFTPYEMPAIATGYRYIYLKDFHLLSTAETLTRLTCWASYVGVSKSATKVARLLLPSIGAISVEVAKLSTIETFLC